MFPGNYEKQDEFIRSVINGGGMKKMTRNEMEKRIAELEETALTAFCDDVGFCVDDWLDDEDRKEYNELLRKIEELDD